MRGRKKMMFVPLILLFLFSSRSAFADGERWYEMNVNIGYAFLFAKEPFEIDVNNLLRVSGSGGVAILGPFAMRGVWNVEKLLPDKYHEREDRFYGENFIIPEAGFVGTTHDVVASVWFGRAFGRAAYTVFGSFIWIPTLPYTSVEFGVDMSARTYIVGLNDEVNHGVPVELSFQLWMYPFVNENWGISFLLNSEARQEVGFKRHMAFCIDRYMFKWSVLETCMSLQWGGPDSKLVYTDHFERTSELDLVGVQFKYRWFSPIKDKKRRR